MSMDQSTAAADHSFLYWPVMDIIASPCFSDFTWQTTGKFLSLPHSQCHQWDAAGLNTPFWAHFARPSGIFITDVCLNVVESKEVKGQHSRGHKSLARMYLRDLIDQSLGNKELLSNSIPGKGSIHMMRKPISNNWLVRLQRSWKFEIQSLWPPKIWTPVDCTHLTSAWEETVDDTEGSGSILV